MRGRLIGMTLVALPLMIMTFPAAITAASAQDSASYAGTWAGTYSAENGGSGKVTYIFTRDDNGQLRGTVKYSNDDGERSAELKALKIEGAKFKAKIVTPDESNEITLEGKFNGNSLEGTYAVSEKGSTEVVEKGTFKTTKG